MMPVLSEAHARRCHLGPSEEEHAVPAALREASSSRYKHEDAPEPFEGIRRALSDLLGVLQRK